MANAGDAATAMVKAAPKSVSGRVVNTSIGMPSVSAHRTRAPPRGQSSAPASAAPAQASDRARRALEQFSGAVAGDACEPLRAGADQAGTPPRPRSPARWQALYDRRGPTHDLAVGEAFARKSRNIFAHADNIPGGSDFSDRHRQSPCAGWPRTRCSPQSTAVMPAIAAFRSPNASQPIDATRCSCG